VAAVPIASQTRIKKKMDRAETERNNLYKFQDAQALFTSLVLMRASTYKKRGTDTNRASLNRDRKTFPEQKKSNAETFTQTLKTSAALRNR
jgi:hypothetical protein